MWARAAGVCLLSVTLTGCGIITPDMKEIWDGPEGTMQMEFQIKKQVYCSLREAVQYTNANNVFQKEDEATGRKRTVPILPDDWGAQVSLSLQVDESSALTPGANYSKLRPNAITRFGDGSSLTTGQSFSLGLGATISSAATRIDKFEQFYTIARLMEPARDTSPCDEKNDPFIKNGERPAKSSPLIYSDLKIKEWLDGAMFTNSFLPSDNPGKSPGKTPDTVTFEAKFVIVTSGNVTPTWRLMPISVNTGPSLFAAGRTRTHDLIITIGPQKGETSQAHFASQIGLAVSNATMSSLRAP